MSSSDSDSDGNEDMKKLLSAIDTNFMSDKMFGKEKSSASEAAPAQDKLKSQRIIDTSDPIFQSELNVSESMQKHFYKKLSSAIERQVDFINPPNETCSMKFPKLRSIKLVGDGEVLKPQPLEKVSENPNIGRRKLEIKRRIVKDQSHEVDRIKESVVEFVRLQKETNSWKERKHKKIFPYRTKKGVNYFVEPETEFTKLRKKNNWTEGKISTTHK